MPNPFNILNPNDPMRAYGANMQNIQGIYQAIMGSRDPMLAFRRIASMNPSMQPVLQALQGGANPRQVFSSLCMQKGIDPQEFMRQITGNNAF